MSTLLPVPYPTAGKLARLTDTQSPRRDLWAPSSFDYDVFEDNFWGDALNAIYPAAKTNGTSAAVTFAEHNENGYLSLVSGTSNDGYAGQGLGLQLTGDRGALFEAVIELPADIGNNKFEIGLSDADDDDGAVLLKTTPTNTATDYAVIVYDTDDDANWGCASAKAGVDVGTQDNPGDAPAPAVDTVYRVAIRIDGDNVEFFMNDKMIAGHGGNAGIEGASKLTPWVFCQSRDTTSAILKLHKWRVTQPAY